MYTQLSSKFQRIARRDKKVFLIEPCKEIEENNRMGKTSDLIKKIVQGLPWRLNGNESAYQCRRHRFELWSGKIPQASDQLSLCTTPIKPVFWSLKATTTEPVCCNCCSPCTQSPCFTAREVTTIRSLCTATKSSPHLPQLQKSPQSNEDPIQSK